MGLSELSKDVMVVVLSSVLKLSGVDCNCFKCSRTAKL